jgi:hypothetical protein
VEGRAAKGVIEDSIVEDPVEAEGMVILGDKG